MQVLLRNHSILTLQELEFVLVKGLRQLQNSVNFGSQYLGYSFQLILTIAQDFTIKVKKTFCYATLDAFVLQGRHISGQLQIVPYFTRWESFTLMLR